jgi:hypothetical protein
MQGRLLKRGREAALALGLLALAALAAWSTNEARADGPPRQTATLATTEAGSGRPTGMTIAIEWQGANPGDKPPTAQSVSLALPQGMAIHTSSRAQCAASDQELIASGVDACPDADSHIGGGTLVTDTGSPGGPPRYITYELIAFNGAASADGGEILVLADSTGTPSRFVIHATVSAGTISAELPLLPGAPGPDPFLAFKSLQLTIAPPPPGTMAYVTTPPSCAGFWTGVFDFAYRDQGAEQVAASTPCTVPPAPPRPPSSKKPRIQFRGVPAGKCTKGSFMVKVRIASPGVPRLVAVYFDGRKAGTTQAKRFKLRIHSEGLPSGTHRLKLRVIGENGRRAIQTARFRRC